MGINDQAWSGGFKRCIGDPSLGDTLAIAVDTTTKQVHICDITDVGTDWALTADSYPSLYIHDIAAPSTDYVKVYHDGTNGIIDCDGTTVMSLTATTLDITGDLGIEGDVTVTGGVTWTGAVDVVLTAPTTANDAFYGRIIASAAWAAGNMVGVRGKVEISGANNYVSATGVWAGLTMTTATGTGTGLLCAINAEVYSNNAARPNAILYLQSLPQTNADFREVPFIAFTETGAGTGSNILFSLGHTPAGAGSYVTTGSSGNILYQQTIHITANGSDAYIPYSTVEGTYTTAYLIQSSLATASTSTATGAVIIAGGVGIGGATFIGGTLVVNDAGADIDTRIESANLEYAFYVDGAKDCVVIGDNTDKSDVDVRLYVGNVAKTLATGQSAAILHVAPTASTTEFTSGTHAYITTAYFKEPNITHAASGTITTASTVHIADAPTEGTTNAALYIESGQLEVGTKATPVSLDTYTGADDIHVAMFSSNIAAAMTSGEAARNIWSRMKVSTDQAQNVSVYGACLQLRVNTSSATVDLGAGLYAGAWLYYEASDSANVFTISGGEHMGAAAAVELSSAQVVSGGSIYGIKINSAVHGDVSMASADSFSALYINAGSGKEPWTTGIEIEGGHVVTGITLNAATTGLSITGTYATATSKAINSTITVDVPNYTDGLGANNFDLTTTGVMAGHTAATSSWISLNGTVATGGWIVAAQTNGIWVNTGGSGNITNAIAVIGMRMSAITTTNASKLTCFSVNVSGDVLDGIFHVAAGENNLGEVANAGTALSFLVPLYINDAGVKKYVKLYDLQ